MHDWLQRQTSPFHRVNATIGPDKSVCVFNKKNMNKEAGGRCRGVTGLVMSELDIIQNYNTIGLTVVLEDDFRVIHNLRTLVEKTINMVPADWDVIRWDCKGKIPETFEVKHYRNAEKSENHQNAKVFRTYHTRTPKREDWFCGGTHAMLWRDSSLTKLANVWSQQPFHDIDCRLTTPMLNSYCVNLHIGEFVLSEGERSDIPHITRRHFSQNQTKVKKQTEYHQKYYGVIE